jgi:hypothetical protein
LALYHTIPMELLNWYSPDQGTVPNKCEFIILNKAKMTTDYL